MRPLFHSLLSAALIALTVRGPVFAFSDDIFIESVDLNAENFIDIRAQRFRKSQDYAWYDSLNGWRIAVASLDGDTFWYETELKFQHQLSKYVNVRMDIEQEVFFNRDPFPPPRFEVQLMPWGGNLGIGVQGHIAYDKRDNDVGLAITYGQRPWEYIRLGYMQLDAMYNEKNQFDDTRHTQSSDSYEIEGAYQQEDRYKMRFKLQRNTPLEMVSPDVNGTYNEEGDQGWLLFDYNLDKDTIIGTTLRGFESDKVLSQTGQDQSQAISYASYDFYYVKGLFGEYEISTGVIYDQIHEHLVDRLDSNVSRDYRLESLQAYSSVYHRYNDHMAWDVGLHVARVNEITDLLSTGTTDEEDKTTEAALRTSWEYRSADGTSALVLHFSFNLDDLANDPSDGGGASFQAVF